MEQIIKKHFNQSANTYDHACSIQQATNVVLLAEFLKYNPRYKSPLCIADLGCGTGNSTLSLLKTYQCKTLYAIDVADKLLQIAKNKIKTPSVEFIQASFNQKIVLTGLDLMYANMSLHWASSLEKTLNMLIMCLKKHGFLSFSIPLEGTLFEIKGPHKNMFFSLDAILSIIDNTPFSLLSVHQETFVDKFASPIDALQSIKRIGANSILEQKKKGLSSKSLYANVFKNPYTFNLTYQVGFFVLKK
jgi:malonyl-CoA O-methyltransferase